MVLLLDEISILSLKKVKFLDLILYLDFISAVVFPFVMIFSSFLKYFRKSERSL